MVTIIVLGLILIGACVIALIAWGVFASHGDDFPRTPDQPVTDVIPSETTAELARRYERIVGDSR